MKGHEALRQAIAFNREERPERAIRLLAALKERVPNHPAVLIELARALHAVGRTDEALAHLEILHEIEPDNRDARLLHHEILAATGPAPGADDGVRDITADCEDRAAEGAPPDAGCADASGPVRRDDPDQAEAVRIARDIRDMVNMPPPHFCPAEPDDFPRSARSHCRRLEQNLAPLGFRRLGDYRPLHLDARLGRPTFIRFLCHEDEEVAAAVYRVYPKRPAWLTWLIMLVLGQWRRPKVIELQSELSDGRFVITNNTADLDPFDGGPDFLSESFPANTPASTLLEYHRSVLAELRANDPGVAVVRMPDFDALVASEARQQALKSRYRREVGLATDAELRAILGRRFDRYGQRIRECLAELMAREKEVPRHEKGPA